jgi:hypothetical protein
MGGKERYKIFMAMQTCWYNLRVFVAKLQILLSNYTVHVQIVFAIVSVLTESLKRLAIGWKAQVRLLTEAQFCFPSDGPICSTQPHRQCL